MTEDHYEDCQDEQGRKPGDGIPVPMTVEAAMRVLKLNVSKEDKEFILSFKDPEAMAAAMHHELGRWIRNMFELWKPNRMLLKDIEEKFPDQEDEKHNGLIHPDSASWILTLEFRRRLETDEN